MKKTLLILSAAMAALILTGCGGPDKARLAALTGDKTFEQIKEAYKSSILQEKPRDTEVYAYYLEENGVEVAGFDFDMYSQKVQSDYKKMKNKLETTLSKFRENIDNVSYAQLRNELTMSGFMMGQARCIDDYAKAIEGLIAEKRRRDEERKKAEKAQARAKMLANETPSERNVREWRESKGLR